MSIGVPPRLDTWGGGHPVYKSQGHLSRNMTHTPPASETRTLVEVALRHERWATGALLILLPLACWTWIGLMARDMYGSMLGPSAWMMTASWDGPHLVLLWAMWAVMMTAMMLPSAAPLVLLFAGALRTRGVERTGRRIYALAGGYVLVWALFSVAATVLQRALSSALVLTPMMEPATPMVAAAILAAAGLYQWTPLKGACLHACRSPLSFLMQHWGSGDAASALRLGVRHGLYCVGCCWVLMLLLFAGGVMNLVVILALTAWVLVEKLAPFGAHTARASGLVLLALAAWTALR
jgi:predicted metal-binding membrane protein